VYREGDSIFIGHSKQVLADTLGQKIRLPCPKPAKHKVPHCRHFFNSELSELTCCFSCANVFQVAEDLLTAGLTKLGLPFLRPESVTLKEMIRIPGRL
jgi:hypothetical protein